MRRPHADPAIVADGLTDGCYALGYPAGEVGRHARLVGGHQLKVVAAMHGLAGAGVHQRAGADLVDRVLLRQLAIGRVDDRGADGGAPVHPLGRIYLPIVGGASDIDAAEEHPLERVQRAEEESGHDVGPHLPLHLDGLELQGQRVPGVDLGIELVDEVPLVLDEQRHRDTVGNLATEDGLEALSPRHRLAWVGHRLLSRLMRVMVSHASIATSPESRLTGTTCAVP